jgi:hypothetical protein
MFVKRLSKAVLVAVVALSLGVVSTAARAGDGNIAQQSSGKGCTQSQQCGKGKNDYVPYTKPCSKGKNCVPSKQKGFNNKFNSGTNTGTNSGANLVVSGNQ